MIVLAAIIAILGLGFGIVEGIGQAAGGISLDLAIFYGVALVIVVAGRARRLLRSQTVRRPRLAKRREASAARAGGR